VLQWYAWGIPARPPVTAGVVMVCCGRCRPRPMPYMRPHLAASCAPAATDAPRAQRCQACAAAPAEWPGEAGWPMHMLCCRGVWRRCCAGDPARSAWPREAADGADGSPPGDAPSSCGEDDGPPGLCGPASAQALDWRGREQPVPVELCTVQGTALACREPGLPPQEQAAWARPRLGPPWVPRRRMRGCCRRLLSLGAHRRRGPAADPGAAVTMRRLRPHAKRLASSSRARRSARAWRALSASRRSASRAAASSSRRSAARRACRRGRRRASRAASIEPVPANRE